MGLYKPSSATPRGGKTYSLGKVKATSVKMPKGKALRMSHPKVSRVKVKV